VFSTKNRRKNGIFSTHNYIFTHILYNNIYLKSIFYSGVLKYFLRYKNNLKQAEIHIKAEARIQKWIYTREKVIVFINAGIA
jgi:hypothetical protein